MMNLWQNFNSLVLCLIDNVQIFSFYDDCAFNSSPVYRYINYILRYFAPILKQKTLKLFCFMLNLINAKIRQIDEGIFYSTSDTK